MVTGAPEPGLEERVARLEGRVEGFEGRFDGLERRFDIVERRIDGLDAKLDRLFGSADAKVDRFREELSSRIGSLDAKVSVQFRWLVGIQVTASHPNGGASGGRSSAALSVEAASRGPSPGATLAVRAGRDGQADASPGGRYLNA